MPLFYGELANPSLQITNHGDLHVGYVHELLLRETPPQNIFVPGYPANFYWLYHAVLAALVQLTGLAPPLVASILVIAAICGSFYWLSEVLVGLGLAKRRALWLGLLIVLVYCAVNITGALSLGVGLLEGGVDHKSLRVMLLPGADRRLHSVMGKVMNFTSTGLGILCFIAALHVCLRLMRNKLERLDAVVFSACVALCLAARQTAALYIVVALAGGVGLSGAFLLFRRQTQTSPMSVLWTTIERLSPRFVALWLVASAGLTLPLLHYYAAFTATNGVGMGIRLVNRANIEMLLASLAVFLPLHALQWRYALRDRDWTPLALQTGGLLGLALTAILLLPNGDQHKAVYYVSILLALSGLLALKRLAETADRGAIQPAKWLTITLIALALAKVAWVTRVYDVRAGDMQIAYAGSHLVYQGGYIDDTRMAAYTWIRENALADAIVALPLDVHKYEHVFHERRSYVRQSQYWFTYNIPAYDARTLHIARLFNTETGGEDYRQLLLDMQAETPGVEIYLVFTDDELSGEVMAERGALRVFGEDGIGARVYRLTP